MYIAQGRVDVPLTDLTPPHICTCHKTRHGFIYVVVFFVFNEFWWERIVRFVDIGGLVSWSSSSLFKLHVSNFLWWAEVLLCQSTALIYCTDRLYRWWEYIYSNIIKIWLTFSVTHYVCEMVVQYGSMAIFFLLIFFILINYS